METKHKAFLTYIKGHNSVVSERNKPTCNPIPLLLDTNVYAKFEENRSKGTEVRARKQSADGWTDRRMDDGRTDEHSKFGGYNMIIYIYQCICKILLKFVYSFLRYWAKMHLIKGHNSCCFWMKLSHLQSHTTPPNTNVCAKFEENR